MTVTALGVENLLESLKSMRRLDRAAAEVKPALAVIAIGMTVITLTYFVGLLIMDRLPPITRVSCPAAAETSSPHRGGNLSGDVVENAILDAVNSGKLAFVSAARTAAMNLPACQIGRLRMGVWVGPRSPGAFESGAGVLSEINHALALIGAAHWMENFSTGAHPRDQRQNASIKWHLWGHEHARR
jgi:hypothetical protein